MAEVLIIDDDEQMCTLLSETVRRMNHHSVCSVTLEQGLKTAVSGQFDVVLLDVNMPDMDGLETCARLKSDPSTAEIPIIFVSALASQEELMAGYEAGGDDYITKPFSEEILQKKIEIVLASQQRKQEYAPLPVRQPGTHGSDHCFHRWKGHLSRSSATRRTVGSAVVRGRRGLRRPSA